MFSFPPFLSFQAKKVAEKFKTLPSSDQCRKFFGVLNNKEKKVFFVFFLSGLISFAFLATGFYLNRTEPKPSLGGKFVEGAVGEPRFINPVLSPASDIDRDLVELVFAGLMKYSADGTIVKDLAQDYQVKENGKVWEITLKDNLVFQDGTPLTADDVIFTVKIIQNPDYKSPLRSSWLGIETEKMSGLGIRFKLKNAYPGFLESLTLKILPKKIWEEIPPENFALNTFNLRPVGSGPYKVEKIVQNESGAITSLNLVINPQYNGESSKIKEISFVFFNNESELLIAAQKKQVQSFVLTLPESLKSLEKNKYQLRLFQLPRYFAVFFNPKNSSVLSSQKVRQALNYGTRKQELIDKVLDGQAKTVDSPLLPDIFGLEAPKTVYEFSLDKAKELLEQDGFKINPQTGFREKTIQKNLTFEFKSTLSKGSQGVEVKELQKCLAKDPAIYPEGEITGVFGDKTKQAVIRFQEKYRQDVLEPSDLDKGNGEVGVLTRKKLNDLCIGPKQQVLELKFSLLTVDDPDLLSDDFLSETTEILKNQWKALGVNVETRSYDFSKLNMDYIKPRAYDALLFGEVLGEIPDPLPFWHSLQKKDPGVNLAVYENKDVDALLEQARQTFDEGQRKEKLGQLQDILLQDAPAVFLYRPNFLYLTSDKIKGVETGLIVDPSKRFSGITEWYINTKKVWK